MGLCERTLSYKTCAVLVFVFAVVILAQAAALEVIHRYTIEATAACEMTSVREAYTQVFLDVKCVGGKVYETEDAEVIVSYFNNPGPLTCDVYASGKAFCQSRPPKP